MKFDFDDFLIVPKIVTGIDSRKQVNPFIANGYLPIFTAPMDTVVNDINMKFFHDNKINVVLPRTVPGRETMSTSENCFVSFGLDEFINLFLDNTVEITNTKYVLIDIANGHMHKLVLTIEHAKDKYGTLLKLMVGNIANPETYRMLSLAGADYIRVGIGNGCFTDGSIIPTINGKKPIEKVIDGDLVLTHNRNYKEVINTKRFEYTGELIKINDEITCTPDHEFYVLPKKYLGTVTDDNIHTLSEWVSAMELYNNPDYLLIETDDNDTKDTI